MPKQTGTDKKKKKKKPIKPKAQQLPKPSETVVAEPSELKGKLNLK